MIRRVRSQSDAVASERRFAHGPQIRVGGVVAVALLIGFVVWLFVRGADSPSTVPALAHALAPAPVRAGAVPVSLAALTALAGSSASPVYWAGPRQGSTYELTKTADGRAFIRYLPRGVAVGTDKPYLTIGTYPVAGAFTVANTLARRSGSVKLRIGGGAVAFYDPSSPSNVYFAYPGSSYRVEVYDPSPAEARRLVSSGQVVPVTAQGASSQAPAEAVTQLRLGTLVASLREPVYWAGARAGVRYELSRSPGRIFVRYLPRGAAVGSDRPYLTIGTYRLRNAFAITKARAQSPGSVRIAIAGGGVAFYSATRSTNVYLAYPGTGIQIEVYDPMVGRARGLVASQSITPVG